VNFKFAVVHEARADFLTATELADRVLVESIVWLEVDMVEHQRNWLHEWKGASLTWKRIKQSALDAEIRVRGFFDGEPAQPDAQAARRAILYLRHAIPDLAGVLLIRDQDDEPARRAGLEQAQQQERGGIPVIVGLAVVERECWVISGFDPENQGEEQKLAAETQNLGFNPCLHSHELTASKSDQAKRSPKRVLAVITDSDWERQRKCWLSTSLSVLETRGQANGLIEYLREVKKILVPLIAGYGRTPEP
jgi:hypothetical protein